MKKSGNSIKTIIAVIIMILLVVGFYFALSTRGGSKDKGKTESNKELDGTEKETNEEKILSRDLEKEYPPTPTAVLSYYSDLLLAYYSDSCSDDMREKLVEQSRLLYDGELLQANTEKDQMINLDKDVSGYKDMKKRIINYTVCKPEDVAYGNLDEDNVALAIVSYRIRTKDELSDLEEEFFLRKDKEGRWKIVGWQLPKARPSK